MKKHIVPVLNTILLIIFTFIILYDYSFGYQTDDLAFLVIFITLMNTDYSYWKEVFTK